MTIFIAIGLITLMIFLGAAMDLARGHVLKSRLSSALDAAGLAGGAVVNSQDVGAMITKYFNANFPPGYMDAQVDGPNYTVSEDNHIITLDASAQINTVFMQLAGYRTLTAAAHAEITRENKGMELVMVLDVTGSMGNNNKLQTMKTAAKELVDIVYGTKETVENVWVGLVPFSQSVNIGTENQAWLDAAYHANLSYGPNYSWTGCVEAQAYPLDTGDNPPAESPLRTYFWPDDSSNDWIRDNGSFRAYDAGRGPNLNCPPSVLPLVAEKTIIKNKIDTFTAQGFTLSNMGMDWGWRMISPRWRGLWNNADPTRLPMDYRTELMNKVVILLTDGVNDIDGYTAYGYRSEGRLDGQTTKAGAVGVLNSRLGEVCAAMKAENIIIYTITFQLNNTTTQNLFRACATKPTFYFNSPDNASLRAAFRTIGDALGNLRISE